MKKLIQVLMDKTDDDEFVIQILYIIYQFIVKKLEIEYILKNEHLINQLLIYITDKNENIKNQADEIFEILRVCQFFKKI